MNNLQKKDKELKIKNHLAAYDLLKSFASWLDSPENEVFSLLEFDDSSLNVVAKANVLAAAILKKAAFDIQLVSGIEDTNKYSFDVSDALENLAAMANEFDSSENLDLVKKASLIDEILVTISNDIDAQKKFKLSMDKKIEDIKKRSKENQNDNVIKTEASIDDTEKNSYRPLQAPLSTRSFPGAPGQMMVRVNDNVFYNVDTGEQINLAVGYNLNGKKVPATSVENQTETLEGVAIPNQFK